MIGKFSNELSEQFLGSRKVDFLQLRAAVAFVNALVIVVSEDRIVAVRPTVVGCILDHLREFLGLRNAKHPDPDDRIAEIASPVANDFNVTVVFQPRLMVVAPSK